MLGYRKRKIVIAGNLTYAGSSFLITETHYCAKSNKARFVRRGHVIERISNTEAQYYTTGKRVQLLEFLREPLGRCSVESHHHNTHTTGTIYTNHQSNQHNGAGSSINSSGDQKPSKSRLRKDEQQS